MASKRRAEADPPTRVQPRRGTKAPRVADDDDTPVIEAVPKSKKNPPVCDGCGAERRKLRLDADTKRRYCKGCTDPLTPEEVQPKIQKADEEKKKKKASRVDITNLSKVKLLFHLDVNLMVADGHVDADTSAEMMAAIRDASKSGRQLDMALISGGVLSLNVGGDYLDSSLYDQVANEYRRNSAADVVTMMRATGWCLD
jgi:hypothetical protein